MHLLKTLIFKEKGADGNDPASSFMKAVNLALAADQKLIVPGESVEYDIYSIFNIKGIDYQTAFCAVNDDFKVYLAADTDSSKNAEILIKICLYDELEKEFESDEDEFTIVILVPMDDIQSASYY